MSSTTSDKFCKMVLSNFIGGSYNIHFAIRDIYNGFLRSLGIHTVVSQDILSGFCLQPNEELGDDNVLTPAVMSDLYEAYVDKKSGGVFYTPNHIVDYMVKTSLEKHLLSILEQIDPHNFDLEDINPERIKSIFTDKWADFSDGERAVIFSIFMDLRVLDPACGSGAFIMGALSRLYDILRKIDPEADAFELKSMIAKNCLYGIDISGIATKIAQYRININILLEDPKRYNELPDLRKNFITGDALILQELGRI